MSTGTKTVQQDKVFKLFILIYESLRLQRRVTAGMSFSELLMVTFPNLTSPLLMSKLN